MFTACNYYTSLKWPNRLLGTIASQVLILKPSPEWRPQPIIHYGALRLRARGPTAPLRRPLTQNELRLILRISEKALFIAGHHDKEEDAFV